MNVAEHTNTDISPATHPEGACSRDTFLGRQPIYDSRRKIHAYELLFRTKNTSAANVIEGNAATADVLLNTLTIGIDTVCPDALLFINCTRDFLMSDPVLPPQQCVLEVLEDIELDDKLVTRLRYLRRLGYRIALDDFIYADTAKPALAVADYVKLDVLALSQADLRTYVKTLRPYGLRLIAEKIDSEAQLDFCRDLGFHLFQGYFLRRPEVLSAKRLQPSKLAALRLLSQCQDPDVPIERIASVIACDVSMTYGLLRMANSGMFGRAARINSITEAILWLGTDRVIGWATILRFSKDQDCPKGYLEYALQRAAMCESLAEHFTGVSAQISYLTGLLSVLDSMLGLPFTQIIGELPLNPQIVAALTKHEGQAGRLLDVVVAYERGDWTWLANCGIPRDVLLQAYWKSVQNASAVVRLFA